MTWDPVTRAGSKPVDGHADDRRAEPTHLQVLRQIEERILDGRLRPGDRLPGERDLGDLLGVSRGSVREALRVLRAMGIVSSGAGRGPDSGSIVAGEPTNALSDLLRLHLALSRFDLDDLVDTRIQLEGHAADLAAGRADQESLARLGELVDAMSDPQLPAGDFHALDTEFHVLIGVASGNRLLGVLMQGLRDSVEREMVLASEGVSEWGPVARRLHREHEEILRRICDGDGAEAARLLDRHIRRFYSEIVNPGRADL
jgi:DNA-binding FadR family transcriptional regulator